VSANNVQTVLRLPPGFALSAAALADFKKGTDITRRSFVNFGPADAGGPALNGGTGSYLSITCTACVVVIFERAASERPKSMPAVTPAPAHPIAVPHHR